ncbi:MAG: 4-aminobutyrate aminotransferase [delta proteobacterium ML8_F1]|nr:MAG: 4-aminobutyrate aminotransferase [delta proteobacterium ML8_F1]
MSLTTIKCQKLVDEDHSVIAEASRSHYFPVAIAEGRGAVFKDLDGNGFIDLTSSAAVLNTGQSHPRVVGAVKDQLEKYIHFSSDYLYQEPQVRLAEKLVSVVPGDFKKKVSFGHSGSDAIDGAIKMARAYKRRGGIISFSGAYHGTTYGALTASGISHGMRRGLGPMLPEVYHMPYPDCYRCPMGHKKDTCQLACMDYFEQVLQRSVVPDEVAAVLIEPIAGDFGFSEPPRAYWEALSRLCQRHGMLLIVDEVQMGMGRTGKWFSFEHFGVVPDMVVMGKALGSGMPISAVVARSEIIDALEVPGHLLTLQGNPLCARAALATLEVIEEEGLIERSALLGRQLKEAFERLQGTVDIIGEVRGRGLCLGVDLVKDLKTRERDLKGAAKVVYEAYQRGVLVLFLAGNVLRIQPPLVIQESELQEAFGVLREAVLAHARGELPDEGLYEVQGW